MYKTVRSLALALLLTLAVVPAIKADRWGTNPRPQSSDTDSSTVDAMMATVSFYLGIF